MTLAVMVVSTALEQLIFDRARESGVGELLRMVSNACRIRVRDVGDYPQEDDGVR
jgi:ATP-dependent Lon protease